MGKKVLRDRNAYFAITPNWLWHCGISLQAVATFGYIQGHYGGSKLGIFPKIETLATALKVSPRSVRTYLRELEGVGAVRATRRGFNQSNLYELAGDTPLTKENDADNKQSDGSLGVG